MTSLEASIMIIPAKVEGPKIVPTLSSVTQDQINARRTQLRWMRGSKIWTMAEFFTVNEVH